ncbi:hypothetical protein DFJ74DRAFT_696496 [Hyaloraphidium curvatum]|nr:hypothetical protein DFJ74DRAFT_696496 [Hyaloraphidium curvatum]
MSPASDLGSLRDEEANTKPPARGVKEDGAQERSSLWKRAVTEGVVGVRVCMMNVAGIARGHVFPTKRFFSSVADKGAQCPYAYMIIGPQDLMASGLPPDTFGCVGAVNWKPDLSSLKPLPYHPTNYWCAADLYTDASVPWEYCPRSLLKKHLGRLRDKFNAELVVGPEFEFHMFTEFQETGMPAMWLKTQCGEMTGLLGKPAKVMDSICSTLGAAGIDLNNWHDEGGNIQWEFSLAPYEALKQADNIVYTRQAVKAVAMEHGYKATMAPKPLGEKEIGNGGHMHFSLRDIASGSNSLEDDREEYGISQMGKYFMAGILEHLPGLCAVILPTEMSYARAKSHMWAGVYSCWGRENKEAAIRVCCPGGKLSNIELKLPDSTSNPYLAIAMILAAGMDGIERKLELPPETTMDPADASDEVRGRNKITPAPGSLDEALAAFKEDTVLQEAMGRDFARVFSTTNRFIADYVQKLPDKERYEMYCMKY